MLTISEFIPSEEEYAALVAVHNGAWPDDPTTLAAVKHRDATRNPAYYYRRVVGRLGEYTVAVASAMESSWSYRPGKYHLSIDIHADFEGAENRSQLYDELVTVLSGRDPPLFCSHPGRGRTSPTRSAFLRRGALRRSCALPTPVYRWTSSTSLLMPG